MVNAARCAARVLPWHLGAEYSTPERRRQAIPGRVLNNSLLPNVGARHASPLPLQQDHSERLWCTYSALSPGRRIIRGKRGNVEENVERVKWARSVGLDWMDMVPSWHSAPPASAPGRRGERRQGCRCCAVQTLPRPRRKLGEPAAGKPHTLIRMCDDKRSCGSCCAPDQSGLACSHTPK